MSLIRDRSEFIGLNVYFLILFEYGQLFQDMLGEDENSQFCDIEFVYDMNPINDTKD